MPTPLLSGLFLRTTLANFLFFLNFASFFLLPLHIKALGGSEAMVGAVMGTQGIATLSVLPFVGVMIDRVGRRRFLMLGAAGMTAASASYLFIDRVGPALFAVRLLQGVSFAAAFTATTTFAADFAPRDRRAQALGIFGLSTLLTHALAPGIGEEIVHRGGFHSLFAVTMVFTMLALLIALTLPTGAVVHHVDAAPSPWSISRMEWVVAVTTMLSGMGFGTVITFVSVYVRGEGLGRVGFFFAAYTSTAILSRLVGAGLSDSLGRRRVILPTLLGLAASIALLSVVRNVPMLVVAGMMFGLAQGINYPTMHAFIVDLASDAHLGRAQALFNGAFNLGVTSSAFAFGNVAEHFGHRPMFALASLTPVAAWLVFLIFGRAAGRRGVH